MSRMVVGYRARFEALLKQLNARRLEQGVQLLLARAEQLRQQGMQKHVALAHVHDRLWRIVEKRKSSRPHATAHPSACNEAPHRFVCDSGLAGLARWLRAAGYEAYWEPAIPDDRLLALARQTNAILLTTDSMLLERRLIRTGIIKCLWIPPAMSAEAQLALVFRELGLSLQPARCMSCGGELQPVDKNAVRERVPPKTWRWKDEFFLCKSCDKLFWHGTHWERITQRLNKLTT
ncbi:MAG: Mut7-C RNAse domain-containing protein [Verrucomicrobiae bacterium]|nr:Mut7-C RNAse domain-containing protein [Verrucomicrobiae bacterium]